MANAIAPPLGQVTGVGQQGKQGTVDVLATHVDALREQQQQIEAALDQADKFYQKTQVAPDHTNYGAANNYVRDALNLWSDQEKYQEIARDLQDKIPVTVIPLKNGKAVKQESVSNSSGESTPPSSENPNSPSADSKSSGRTQPFTKSVPLKAGAPGTQANSPIPPAALNNTTSRLFASSLKEEQDDPRNNRSSNVVNPSDSSTPDSSLRIGKTSEVIS